MAKMFIVCIFIKIGNLVGFSWFAITKKKRQQILYIHKPNKRKKRKVSKLPKMMYGVFYGFVR